MDLINFRVGHKTISLKILDILLTERYENNLTSLPNENKSFIGVKDYMDTPTPIFSYKRFKLTFGVQKFFRLISVYEEVICMK